MSASVRDIAKKCAEVMLLKDNWKDSFMRMYKYKTIRPGRFVGQDQYGNKFYEAPQDGMDLRRRWVEMAGRKQEINATKISPEWHTWLTYVDTHTPMEKIPFETQQFQLKYKEVALSHMGQKANFVPSNYLCKPVDVQTKYSKQKYDSWDPAKKVQQDW